LESENVNSVPLITEKVEVEVSRLKAFQHVMKTKVGHDEIIPDNILDFIHQSLSTDKNEKNIEIPLYDQIHQVDVCVICQSNSNYYGRQYRY
jgi:hypothetical protein